MLASTVSSLAANRSYSKTTVLRGVSFRTSGTLEGMAEAASEDYILLYLSSSPLEAGYRRLISSPYPRIRRGLSLRTVF